MKRVLALAIATVALLGFEAAARRLPAPGGKITVALPPELVASTTEAHLYVPIVEPALASDLAARLTRPPLAGFTEWRSSVITSIDIDATSRRWELQVDASAALVGEAITRCLSPRASSSTPGAAQSSWPAAALAARGVTADVDTAASSVVVRFSAPVGVLPELLAGCPLKSASAQYTGAYALVAPGVLAWKGGALAPAPLLGIVELASANAPADLIAFGKETPGAGTLLAPFPDVVLLLQSAGARGDDVLGIADKNHGLAGFLSLMRPDLLAVAYAEGRGAPVDGLLPPGVAPARPLKRATGPDKPLPLALLSLGSDAPRVTVRRPEGDPLVDGVVERLALLLRNRGRLVDMTRPQSSELKDGIEVMRWRPPTTDPALALLSLAGTRSELRAKDVARTALADERLLSRNRDDRVAAALALERAWIDLGVAIPLMTADRWFVVDPDLRGVVIRPDGVPLVDGAYFAGAYEPALPGAGSR
jgi:hypothetical protein